MATFAPTTPTIDPENYMNWSRPISQPTLRSPMGEALKGAGEVIEQGTKFADSILKDFAENKAYDYGKNAQGEFISGDLKDTMVSLLSKVTGENVPGTINQGLSQAGRFASIFESGKIPEILYKSNLDSIAKTLRSQFPAYRDYIDKGIEKATGVTPNANETIRGIMGMMNTISEKLDKERSSVDSLYHEGLTKGYNLNPVYNAYVAGKASTSDFYSEYYNNSRRDADIRNRNAEYEGRKQAGEDASRVAFQNMNSIAEPWINDSLQHLRMPDGTPVTDIIDTAQKRQDGRLTDAEAGQLAPILNENRRRVEADLRSNFRQNGWLKDYTGDPTELFKRHFDQYDQYVKAVTDKDAGLAHAHGNLADAIARDAHFSMLRTWPAASIYAAAQKVGGDQLVAGLITKTLGTKGYDLPTQRSLELMMLGMASGMRNINDVFSATKDGVDRGETKNNTLLDVSKLPASIILSKDSFINDDVRRNIAEGVFGPGVPNIISRVKMDHTDEKGNPVAGKYNLYANYTSEAYAREMNRLGKDRPEIWNHYKDWAESTFTKELFSRDIQYGLGGLTLPPGMHVTWENDPSQHNAHQFVLKNKFGQDVTSYNASMVRLNEGIKSLSNVYKIHGDNVNNKLIELFHSSDIDIRSYGDAMEEAVHQSFRQPIKEDVESKPAEGLAGERRTPSRLMRPGARSSVTGEPAESPMIP
jgi:hypothetical protein